MSCLLIALVGCGTSSDETDSTAPPSASPSTPPGERGVDPALIVMPNDLELGPDPRAPDTALAGVGGLLTGRLRIVAGCLIMEGRTRRLPVWPASTTWDSTARAVVLADGTRLPAGAWIEVVGRTDTTMAADPADGGYGSINAQPGHADQLIDALSDVGTCLSATKSRVVAYELSNVAVTTDGPTAAELGVEPDMIRVVASVLSTPRNGPMLCWGAMTLSDPPQCSGPRITNWDWATVDHTTHTAANSVQRWGSYVVTGRYNADGSEFTLTEPARSAANDDWDEWNEQTRSDWSTPCPEPADGWQPTNVVTTSTPTTSLPPDSPRIAGLEEIAGFGGSWYDRALDVQNVRIVGDDTDHQTAAETIAAVYDGPVCIVDSTHTEAELIGVHYLINERYFGLGPGPDSYITATGVRTDADTGAVVVQIAAPVPGLEAALYDEFGDAVVIDHTYTIID
jgi:hypothetical protein